MRRASAPGTRRLTVAASAVSAADRLTPGLTQAQVMTVGSATVDTSISRVARYSGELHDAFVERHGIETVGAERLAAN